MHIRVDRDLPVPVPTQIQGQVEYGMSTGDFPPGSRLPSVRDLAAELGVSPVTVSGVYRNLRARGLIESVRGSGTFVRRRALPAATEPGGHDPLDVEVARLLDRADRIGVPRSELLARLQAAAWLELPDAVALRVVLVGVYVEATRRYAAALRPHLHPSDRLDTTTFGELDASGQQPLADADLVLTFAHREHELVSRVRDGTPIATVRLIPSTRTRIALAELDPRSRVCLLSVIPEFVPTFRRSFERFASHVHNVTAVVADGGTAPPGRCEDADVVIFGTGSGGAVEDLPSYVRRFEFVHEPDPVHIESVLVPALARLRRGGERDDDHYGAPTPPDTKGTR